MKSVRLAIRLLVLGAVLAVASPPGQAVETEFALKTKAAGLAEGARDLGTTGEEETQQGYLDVNPVVRVQLTQGFATFVRGQVFLPTGHVVQNENDRAVSSGEFAALREFWLEYGGIAGYPGAAVRLGLQRVREPDGLWWDRDTESVRWIFDTTLVQAHFAVAEQFDTYRTDDVELPPSQKDRAYAFGGVSQQWWPGHFVGLRAAYAQDHGDQAQVGTTVDASSKLQERQFGWLGLRAENGYYDFRRASVLAYWAEVTGLTGTRDAAQVDPLTGVVTGTQSDDVVAMAGDVGLRLRFSQVFPLQLGIAGAYGQGGSDNGTSHRFEQTGLQSNRSRFTGTRTLVNRFNEALQADLGNLRVATAFLSLPLERNDASLVFNRFERDDRSGSISTVGVDVAPVNNSRNIGNGWDLVLTHYLDLRERNYTTDDDLRTNLRLRASLFQPGSAYGGQARDQYRVMLEATLWF